MSVNPAEYKMEQSELKGRVGWKSPSNIAIVKYWGKYGTQFPRNPSLSLTLNEAYTEMQIDFSPHGGNELTLNFEFEGKEMVAFAERINKFLSNLLNIFPFLKQLHLEIKSTNSFPHSSGIASSASSMSALALCLCSMERMILKNRDEDTPFFQKASYIARHGSGSACRSVYGQAAIWGEHIEIKHSSQEYAIPFGDEMHEVFNSFHDDILIVSEKKKEVSSTRGHALMSNNIFSETRYQQANTRMIDLVDSIKSGDVEKFGTIAEDEALTLHALMMCSEPSYILMEPESMAIIKAVRNYRKKTQQPIYFSLDAGPNIHLLYPDSVAEEASKFIQDELIQYCVRGRVIKDKVGSGPTLI